MGVSTGIWASTGLYSAISVCAFELSFGGGSVSTSPASSTAGIHVSMGPLAVTWTDSSFFNDVEFGLTPGTPLAFQFDSTANNDAAAADAFTFAISMGANSERV